ncbi:hypothetical protein [Nostoc sp. 106C]|uniref:hypothetical protein n=1 Tax=Nostoc sp. 106C TaxID=1932667 RepID=UPI000A3625A7|nr:hypothetical protein [Nostoc sp. 106C]OUL23351.1 hypothetical protein BV378_21755 [Nostoc sp. RF31YmG]OUL26722.1 hypothetical protein BV375_20875 [Nostoc sp. 106C]
MQKFSQTHSIFSHRLGLFFLLVLGLCSCGNLTQSGLNVGNFRIGSNVTPIREIKPEPNKQATVYIQGKVERQVPLVKRWAYQIDDSTGKIWVVTHQNKLAKGEQVVIKGKVRYQSIPLAGKELGEVYVEEDS